MTVNDHVFFCSSRGHFRMNPIPSLPFLFFLIIFTPFCFCIIGRFNSFIHTSICPAARSLYRKEEFEDGLEEEKDVETPGTESDSDEQEGAVSKRTAPRYLGHVAVSSICKFKEDMLLLRSPYVLDPTVSKNNLNFEVKRDSSPLLQGPVWAPPTGPHPPSTAHGVLSFIFTSFLCF